MIKCIMKKVNRKILFLSSYTESTDESVKYIHLCYHRIFICLPFYSTLSHNLHLSAKIPHLSLSTRAFNLLIIVI